jgi:hypothetical protein
MATGWVGLGLAPRPRLVPRNPFLVPTPFSPAGRNHLHTHPERVESSWALPRRGVLPSLGTMVANIQGKAGDLRQMQGAAVMMIGEGRRKGATVGCIELEE